MTLKVEDSFYPHLKAILDKFVETKQVSFIENDFPQELVVSSVEEVRKRVLSAEERVNNGHYLTQEQYDEQINKFFADS
jgi:hypothetical protein